MNSAYSVFVGDVALDEYFRASQWPASGTKIDLYPLGSHVGGMIANAAAVYAGFGESAHFLWSMNASHLTGDLLADLEGHGIDTGLVVRDDRLADSRNIIILANGDHTVLTPVLGLESIELSDHCMESLRGAQNMYTAIGDMRCLRHAGLGATDVVARIRAGGTRIVLDLDVAPLRPGDESLIGQADLLFVNQVGFQRYCAGGSESEAVAALLHGAASVVVVTLGENGCRVFTSGGSFSVPGLSVENVDVTGAGDTFGASFVHAMNSTSDLVAAATFANAAAARAVTSVGARSGVAAHSDVLDFMRDHGLPAGSIPATPTSAHHDDTAEQPTSERHAT